MIKLEHVVLASPEQMEFIIEGMRNPMNSWEKSDSDSEIKYESWHDMSGGKYEIGPNDHSLILGPTIILSCSGYPKLVQIIENL